MKKTLFFSALALLTISQVANADNTVPEIKPFEDSTKQYQQPRTISDLSDAEIREKIQMGRAKSQKIVNLVIPYQEFKEKLKNTGMVSMNFVQNANNTLFIFTDPNCKMCAQALKQILSQKVLFESNKINIKWIPVVTDGQQQTYKKAIRLLLDDPQYQDTTPNQAFELIKRNTEIYSTSFNRQGTPLVFWPTNSVSNVDIVFGYPKRNVNNSFLRSVAKKQDSVEWLLTIAKSNQ